MTRRASISHAAALVAASALSFVGIRAAHAGAVETNSAACGSAPASWNVPDGALVISRSGGVIDAVLSAVGEYYTHSMISHGPESVVSHSTMYMPGTTGWPTYCSTPLNPNELRSGYPGASQIDQGAIYAFLYLDGEQVQHIIYQRSMRQGEHDERGAEVTQFLGAELARQRVVSRQDPSLDLARFLHHQTGAAFNYVLYQYRNQEQLNLGAPAWNDGSVCSTFLAYAHHMAGNGAALPKTYAHEQMVAAGDALYAAVDDRCNRDTGWLLDVASRASCFEGICDDAARQTRNCMASGVCDSDDAKYWTQLAQDSNAVAVSISPDRLGGWSGNPYEGDGVSVWASDVGAEVQWNSGGDVYGCWF
ncbi:MAG: hypothetical protein ACOY0T_22295 [Myxococcota bacterium]